MCSFLEPNFVNCNFRVNSCHIPYTGDIACNVYAYAENQTEGKKCFAQNGKQYEQIKLVPEWGVNS